MAVKCDDGSPYTHYLSFKIALMKTDEQQALVSLEKMASTLDRSTASGEHQTLDADVNIHGFICLAAQLAFEQSNRVVALRALEHLVKHSPSPQQVLTSLRCLTRLRLTSDNHTSMAKDRQALVTYLKSALTELLALTEKGTVMGTNIQEEASWFMKIAWNMALQCEDSPQEMHGLFILCSKLSGLCDVDMACLVRQKTCMLMAAAASLQVARQAQDKLHKRCALQECIANIDGCLCVCARIQDYKLSETASQNKDLTTPVLLLLYEFEAKIGLEEDDAERVLEKALLLPQAEPKAFETMAALAMGPSGRNRALGVRALKIAIKKHLQQPRADFEKCSKAFHSLVEVALQGGSSTDPASREEAWGYYMDVVDVIENKAKGEFPEMEVLWLMTKAWNCGVHLFSAGRYSDAEQWCELGMRLLKQLTTLHSNYEAQMKDLFGEIKTKIDAKKGIISN